MTPVLLEELKTYLRHHDHTETKVQDEIQSCRQPTLDVLVSMASLVPRLCHFMTYPKDQFQEAMQTKRLYTKRQRIHHFIEAMRANIGVDITFIPALSVM